MPLINNIEDIALASQYPTEKIVFAESSFTSVSGMTTVGGYLKQVSIPHGFDRPLFTRLKWSSDGINWVEGGLGYRSGDASFLPTIAYSDATHVHILTGLSSGTLYYEVIGFWIDDYDATNPAIPEFTDSTNDLFFDGSLNYQKRFNWDEVTGTGTTTININHALGHLAAAWVYYEAFPGQVWPALAGGASNFFLYDAAMGELEVKIHANSLELAPVFVNPSRIWYNIYTE